MIGKTISHYKILEKLGEGGMGVIYKAEDTQLKRPVVLKFLSPELTRDPEAKKRFVHEAQAASALDHPNICTIHEIDETEDGQLFMVMAYYEGETLKQKIAQGRWSVDAMVEMARHIAQGLIAAHEKGIIHRDIKPANVMITPDGMAKILDFGVAKLAGQGGMTRTGMTAGTVAYMSPEQARGEEVDPRTDIWSFGVVLYEMLSGSLPYRGEYEAAMIYSILNESPEPLTSFRGDIPVRLQRVVSRSLEKERTRRYPDMASMLEELETASAANIALPKPEKSIIVLPFVNMSPDPDQEYFSDGLTEEIIADLSLSQIRDLLVISRSSAMTFKGTKKTISDIARAVNVRYVLEGSVRKAGNNLRITAQLIDADTDANLWAEKYSGTLDDVFDIQEKVSGSIVDALKLKLHPEEKKKIAEHPIGNVQAYECYLKANAEIFKFSEDAIDRAISYLQHALGIIGDNAFLYSSMALAYWNLANIGAKQEEYFAKAEECVKMAFTTDPEFPKAHAVLGWINHHGNPLKSAYHLKKALAVSPDDPFALRGLVIVYTVHVGKASVGVPLWEKLVQIDPLDPMTVAIQGVLYFYGGQYDKALEAWRRYYSIDPENPYSQFWYSLALCYHNQSDQAFPIMDQCAEANPRNAIARLGIVLKHGILKDKDKAFQEMTPDFQKTCQRDPTYSHHLAGIFALLEAKEEALDWLEKAVNLGFINYPFLNEYDPFFENIRGEKRFKILMERVKDEWEHFEV